MLNPFPELLTFTLFAPFVLRVAAGTVVLLCAYGRFSLIKRAAESRSTGHTSHVVLFALGVLELVIAGMSIVGWLTQIAALIGGAYTLIALAAKSRLPHYVPLSYNTYALLLAIFASLLVSGAGAFAYDIPL